MKQFSLSFISVVFAFAAARADVTLPPLISDNMLLQSGNPAIWGKADPGENVTVQLGKIVAKTMADSDGKWRVKLDGLKPGLLGEMVVAGKNKLVIRNVAVGDVWVCSGQSNMGLNVFRVKDAEQEAAAANHPGIRMFTVPRTASDTPLDEVNGTWQVCTPENVRRWSATGFFFGRQLHQDLGIPIGLIHTSWGGTRAEGWTPTEVLQGDPDFKATYYDKHQLELANYTAAKEKYEKEVLPAWQAAADQAKADGKPAPPKPVAPRGINRGLTPSALFNGMILGATKYPIKGAIWYQGESNANDAERYHRLLPAMISSWRKAWNQPEFPFYIVQLANYKAPMPKPVDESWAHLREAQRLVSLELPNTGLATIIDIGEEKDIHPKNKQEVGRRLALAAEAKTYGKKIVYSGPFMDAVIFERASAKVTFKPGTAEGLATTDKGSVKGFAIAGDDQKFVWAEARIVAPEPVAKSKGKEAKALAQEPVIVLTSPAVAKPVAVRYAWANNPEVNLVNQAGLPAVPFRTYNCQKEEPLTQKVNQRPWILNDNGNLKSETEVIINNPRDSAFDAWVKIGVAGKPDYMEALGRLGTGRTVRVVHVLELNKDGDNVTFALYDNANGTGTALNVQTYPQKKVRHWRLYVGHNSHLDNGYSDYQEVLKNKKWPEFWDKAMLTDMPNSDTWPDESRIRLEVEGVYQLDTTLRVRDADWFETLKSRLAQGRFAYGAGFANSAHNNWGAEQLARSSYFAERFFKDKTGVDSTKCVVMRDEPTLSWGVIDALVEAGAKSFAIHHNENHNLWRGTTVYPELFYAQGWNPANRLLVWNSPVGNYAVDELKFLEKNIDALVTNISNKLMGYQASTNRYPYDVAMVNFTIDADNGRMNSQVYDNIKALNDKGYVYPRIINANYNQFFGDVAANWSKSIPSFKGTIEDWWNFGAASTAYETGLNRVNHDKLAAAEFMATLASVASPDRKYPYEALANAYENLMLWDEHTWGSPRPAVDEQWRWKRNTAIAADVASTKVLKDSLAAVSALIPAKGKSIVVYNNLSWSRSDLVTVKPADLPEHFNIKDEDSGKAVKYQKTGDGVVTFVAEGVPGLGYKTFLVSPRTDDPVFPPTVIATATSLENKYFKVTFNGAGNITSILDKKNGNAEMVDSSAPFPLNQYVIYKEAVLSGQVESAAVTASSGPVMGTVVADGNTTGLDSLSRKVILYDSLARIDFVNDAVKGRQIANIEMGYFVFPLKVDNFMLRHEMPTGDMRPGVTSNINDEASEQYYTSSTAFYTVNRWIDVSNQRDWGITFASVNAPLVSYGRPDLGWDKKAWDMDYNTPKPWIFSMAFNNEWQTNFQKTQPGRAIFRYSLRGHKGGSWQKGSAETFGAEVASPFKVALIPAAQKGNGFQAAKGQFVQINKDNVVLTTAKMAEANGEGVILRFNEISGKPTSVKVDLSWFAPESVMETDLVENDKAPFSLNREKNISFKIPAFGFKTIRLTRGAVPQPVNGLAAGFDTNGCQVTWADQSDAACYELFRGTNSAFKPGSGTFVASVSVNHYYDQAVKSGLTRSYYYAVRSVKAGRKSTFTAPVQAVGSVLADNTAPSAPMVSGEALHFSKVTLAWQPATDNFAVKGYRVCRDGEQIADVAEVFCSWLDTAVISGTKYSYTVKAYDAAGNLSEAASPVEIVLPASPARIAGNMAEEAVVTVSSQSGDGYSGMGAVDGDFYTDWVSKSEQNPWIRLEWRKSLTIDKVVLYDRPNDKDNASGGVVSFSDGSTIEVTGIPADGARKSVSFPKKDVTWLKFQVKGGVGRNVGLTDIEVLAP